MTFTDPKETSNANDRKLSAILFADIVGYTALMNKDETNARTILDKFHVTLTSTVEAYKGRIINNYGDGCLCIFDSAVAAVRCARAMQKVFLVKPEIPVRIGLHSGDVFFEKDNIFGNSVNTASRIESMGVAGSVLFSEQIKKDIENQSGFSAKYLGEFALKNIPKKLKIFALVSEHIVVPTKAEIGLNAKKQDNSAKWKLFLAAAGIIILLLLFGLYFKADRSRSADPAIPDREMAWAETEMPSKSIAVLPFKIINTGADNQHFAEGMHDDLLTHLSKMGSMKVISRTSVNKYQDTQKTSPEIGRELGVGYLLEGSVRMQGNQVRVNVQLIEAATDNHKWSEIYDRELNLNNIFAIQSEIAIEVAEVLRATISPGLKDRLAKTPTDNLEAYEDFLRARRLMEVRNVPALEEAKSLLEKAIELDQNFALAYVYLGSVHILMVEYADLDLERQYSIADQYLNWGMEIDDQLAEAYALKGLIAFRKDDNFEEASRAFEKAIELNPNYGTAYHWYALAILYLGRDFEKALMVHEKALRLNPLSPVVVNNYAEYLLQTGHPQKALSAFRKTISLEPAFPFAWKFSCRAYSNHLGMLDSAAIQGHRGVQTNGLKGVYLDSYANALQNFNMLDILDSIPETVDLDGRQNNLVELTQQRERAFIEEDYARAISLDRQLKIYDRAYSSRGLGHLYDGLDFQYGPLVEFAAYYHDRQFEKAVAIYEKQIPDFADGFFSPFNMAALNGFQAYIYCLHKIGQAQKAETLWKRHGSIVTNHPEEKDEFQREFQMRELFQIRQKIMQWRENDALDQLANYFESGYLNRWQFVKSDPVFDELRTSARFIQIMDQLEAKVAAQKEHFHAYLSTSR